MTIEAASLAVSKSEQDQNESPHDNRAQTVRPEPESEREVGFDSESDEFTLSLDDDPRGLSRDSGSKRQSATSLDESEVVAGSVEASTTHIYRGLTTVHPWRTRGRPLYGSYLMDSISGRPRSRLRCISIRQAFNVRRSLRLMHLNVTPQLPVRSRHKIDEPGRLHCDFGKFIRQYSRHP